jgi:hypothetical protein
MEQQGCQGAVCEDVGAGEMLRYKQLQPQKQTAIEAGYFLDVPIVK